MTPGLFLTVAKASVAGYLRALAGWLFPPVPAPL